MPSRSSSKSAKMVTFNRVMLPYYFLIPAAVILLIFAAYPVINVFYYAMQNYNPNKPWAQGFVGMENFVKIFTEDKLFRSSFVISIKWCFVQVILQCLFGLVFALVLNAKFRGRGLVRALAFAPWALSGVMVSILWALILSPGTSAVLNDLLMRPGPDPPRTIAWTANPRMAFSAVVVAELWLRGIPVRSFRDLAAAAMAEHLRRAVRIQRYRRRRAHCKVCVYCPCPFLKIPYILTTLLRFCVGIKRGGPDPHIDQAAAPWGLPPP